MAARLFALLLVPALLLVGAAKKSVATAKGENEDLILTVTLHIDPTDIKEMIGSDLDSHFIVAEVKVDPKYGKDIDLDRDDFVLRTDKDGERTKTFVGSQIAGRGYLVVGEGEVKEKKSGWGLGGPIMIGSGRTPQPDDKDKPKPTMKNTDEENPLKKVLDERILPQKKTDQPVGGLLYFPLEKQKMKDLELLFGGKENRISLRFKP
jgi:hypothetical protein